MPILASAKLKGAKRGVGLPRPGELHVARAAVGVPQVVMESVADVPLFRGRAEDVVRAGPEDVVGDDVVTGKLNPQLAVTCVQRVAADHRIVDEKAILYPATALAIAAEDEAGLVVVVDQ